MNNNTALSAYGHDMLSSVRNDPDLLAVRLRGRLVPLVATFAPDLAPDLREEAVQEALIEAVRSPKFDPDRGALDAFLTFMAKGAARKIRAMYSPPGQRTRDRHTFGPSLDEPVAEMGMTIGDLQVDPHDAYEPARDRLEAEFYLKFAIETAPAVVVDGLRLVYSGQTFAEAASEVGANRSTLRRLVDRWKDEFLTGGLAIPEAKAA